MSTARRSWRGFGFWPSFTDVMIVTLLILLFFLFAHMTLNNQALIAARVLQLQMDTAADVKAALGRDSSFVTIVSDGNLQRFSFSDRILFETGEADLLPTGADVIGRVGRVLRDRSDQFSTLQVEGHTDVRPIQTTRFGSNWDLSTARATSVVRYLQWGVQFDPTRLSATGYGEYRPVDPALTPEAMALNRRVDLVIVYTTRNPAAGEVDREPAARASTVGMAVPPTVPEATIGEDGDTSTREAAHASKR